MKGNFLKQYLKICFGVAVFSLLLFTETRATHLRAGEITAVLLDCQSLTYRITIRVYTDTSSPVRLGDGILNFGDGSEPITVPVQENEPTNLGPGVATASYTILHTYGGPGSYTISYLEPNRNPGIINMSNSVNTTFYLESRIIIDPFFGCNNTPRLLIPPIDRGCTGVAFFHNAGAFDPDGDSLSFELVVPKQNRGTDVNGYQFPAAPTFYAGLNFNTANEAGNGPPSFVIDPVSGTITWDSPGAQGEYQIAFRIIEWRRVFGQWFQIGYVTRDMQIIVEDCDNERPDLIIPEDICVEAGTLIEETIFGIDPDNDNVKIEAFSEIFNLLDSPAEFVFGPPAFLPVTPNPAEGYFSWQTTCSHVKEQPYQVVFKITDNGSPNLVTFKTWNIKVIGPRPEWVNATVDLGTKTATLEWDQYTCQNAELIEVWRRVDSYLYDPEECETGMPDFLGYQMISQRPINESVFIDSNNGQGLAPGAKYCYRLVARFPSPRGGESIISEEICLDPILSDVPVITHVTVDATDTEAGIITVSWREPFEIDPGQFPPPYRYEVYRVEGFTGSTNLTLAGTIDQQVNPGDSLTFTDTGLNTEDLVYNYRITLFAPTGASGQSPVDTSVPASSVRLELTPFFQGIELDWSAVVPWSNNTQEFPIHYIYRDRTNGGSPTDLILIDSVNVNIDGFNYVDEGQFNGTPLNEEQEYCYRILAFGSYGNPEINAPQENFSQIICARPNDTIPPCSPRVAIELTDCEEFFAESCNFTDFSNTISWDRREDDDCSDNVQSYNIYFASRKGQQYELIANVPGTEFVHDNLSSFAGCYRISAINRSGIEGELSEEICNDNCPNFELPNVFTPNGDDCNDLFGPYHDNTPAFDETTGTFARNCFTTDLSKCARFVLSVRLVVVNRWGKPVFNYESGGEKSILINWDGRSNEGVELATGTYFYHAEVIFDVVDPAKQKRDFKGWVEIKR